MKSLFLHISKKHLGLTLLLALVIAARTASSLIPPIILGRIVDALAGTGSSSALPGGGLVLAGTMYFALLALSRLLEALQEAAITIWGEKMTHGIRSAMAGKLGRLPMTYFTEHDSGTVSSLFVNDVDTLEDLFSSGVISMAADLASIAGILVVIAGRSRGLFLMLLAALPLLWLFTLHVQKRTLAAQLDQRRAVADLNSQIPETLTRLLPVRLFHASPYMEDRYRQACRRSFSASERTNFYDSVYSPVILLCQAVLTALMMIFAAQSGALRSFFGISAGTAVTCIAYIGQVFTPLADIGMEIQNIQSAMAGASRISDFLGEPEKEGGPAAADSCCSAPAVCIRQMTFAYPGQAPVFSNFSLDLKEGERLLITGRTGAGKSTLFKLILGLYPPDQGQILLLGQEACTVAEKDRRRLFGCVEQNFTLIPGDIFEQISMGDERVSEQEAWDALETAGLADTVRALPGGLHAPCTSESLSHGQFQLLSIARAIVLDPRLLLLDEMSSGLDAATEKALLAALNKAARGRTVLSISHRASAALGAGRTLHLQ